MGMVQDLLNLGLPVAIMAALIVALWIAGIWTLVKDESGPTVLITRLLLVGFVVFLMAACGPVVRLAPGGRRLPPP